MLQLWDSRTRKLEDFILLKKDEVSFYSCGPTVYNRVHIGNIRAAVFSDTLFRYLKFGKNFAVKWVMNITDVDDKTIRDSQKMFPEIEPFEALQKFTRHFEDLFFQDLEKINIPKSSFFQNPRATEFIVEMQDLIQKIFENGFAYEKEGSVYFDVKKYHSEKKYGQLVDIDFDAMQCTERVENDEYEKENIADFVLWKGKKENEPSWDFDFCGKNLAGRPGWHIECSAMEKAVFGDLPFDIHSGGVDLCFPHHEDEIAQSVAGYGKDPNTYWVHNEHIFVEGKKMSKSLGNFFTLEDLENKGFSLSAIRFFLVKNHHQTKVNISEESLEAAEKTLQRIKNFVRTIQKSDINTAEKAEEKEEFVLKNFEQKFFDAMDDNLGTPVATSVLFECVCDAAGKKLTHETKEKIFAFIEKAENIFGVGFFPEEQEIPAEIVELAEKRMLARTEKNWQESDKIRDALTEKGWQMRDEQGGYTLLML